MAFGIHGPMDAWRMTAGMKMDEEGWEERDFQSPLKTMPRNMVSTGKEKGGC